MTRTEQVLRNIVGITPMRILPLVLAIDIAIDLIFTQGIAVEDIAVTKHIYPEVAKQLYKLTGVRRGTMTVARRIERLANFCWTALQQRGLVEEYIGAPIQEIYAPRDVIFYLAIFIYLDKPYFEAIWQEPALLS